MRFRLPEQSRVEILTPSARLEAVRPGLLVGEVFVSRSGLMGLKMTAGHLQVTPVGTPGRVLLAGREPVFLPGRPPAVRGFYFTSDTPVAIPRDARAIFEPSGRSVGYLTGVDTFVIQPGFTANLTRGFPSQLVQFAMAKIPPAEIANDAMPLFDLGGHSVGYVSGPMFYAQNVGQPPAPLPSTQARPPATQAQPSGTQAQPQSAAVGEEEALEGTTFGMSETTLTALSAVGLGGVVAGGVGAGLSSGGGGGSHAAPPPATPVGP